MTTSPASSTSSTISMLERVLQVLRTFTPRTGPEHILAEDVRKALTNAGISFQGEAQLKTGRVDLRVGPIAIELKVKGSTPTVLRQLQRYTRDPAVDSIILVTTSRKMAVTMPTTIGPKPLVVVHLMRL